MKFYNVTQPPLLSGPDDKLMLLLLPPPEFHVFEGNVNKLADALNERWSAEEGVEDRFYIWAESALYIKREEHRKAYDGPSCKKILLNIDSLERATPGSLNQYITAFRDFNQVRLACFTTQLLDSYTRDIRQFNRSCLALRDSNSEPVNLINKMHILFEHVDLFCTLTGKGLGFYSEQAAEAVHYDYLETEKDFQCNEENPKFGEYETAGVVRYNRNHLGIASE